MLNSKDKFDFTLAHYLAYFGFLESMKFFYESGGQVDKKGKSGITPLHIAMTSNRAETVEYLLSLMAVEPADRAVSDLDFQIIKENKERIEKFLRKISFNESLSNSAISSPSVGPGLDDEEIELIEEEARERETGFLLSLLTSDRLIKQSQTIQSQRLEQQNSDEEAEKKQFIIRRRRLRDLRNQRQQNKKTSVELREEQLLNASFNFSGSQEQVKLIQKNVRGWLNRRQYSDTKFAVKILQTRSLGK
jgi:Ankyrin repeats (3 copies)